MFLTAESTKSKSEKNRTLPKLPKKKKKTPLLCSMRDETGRKQFYSNSSENAHLGILNFSPLYECTHSQMTTKVL